MKKLLLFSLVSCLGIASFAQHAFKTELYNKVETAKQYKSVKMNYTGDEVSTAQPKQNSQSITLGIGNHETKIGETTYDLQTNASICSRLARHSDGTMSATWTFHNDEVAGFPNRGTGYNFFDGSTWGNFPTSRVESIRTGWPNIASTASGKEIFISHGNNTERLSQSDRPTIGSGAWNEAVLNVLNPIQLWPRFAVGGTNGETIHVIGLTTPVVSGGTPYNGMDGALLYSRSLDGGVTWEAPIQLPGMGPDDYPEISGDVYSIDANGDVIAIGVAELGQPVRVWKSEDNGLTWENWIAMDNGGVGKFVESEDLVLDTVKTGGGSIAVLVDNNGTVHSWFDHISFVNDDLTDDNVGLYLVGGPTYGPGLGSFGLGYWNENLDEGDHQYVGSWYHDWDGDNAFNVMVENFDQYRYGNMNQLAMMPTVSVDADNNIYLMYAALTDYNDGGGNFFRHVYGLMSDDGGCTWTLPYDMTAGSVGNMQLFDQDFNAVFLGETDDHDFDECVYASAARNVGTDNMINFIFQMDPLAGTNRDDAGDVIPGFNEIVYYTVHRDSFLTKPLLDCFSYVSSDLTGGLCDQDQATLTGGCGISYEWSTGDTTQSIIITTPGTYTAEITLSCTDGQNNLIDTVEYVVEGAVPPSAQISGDLTVNSCNPNDFTVISVEEGTSSSYLWSTGATTSSINGFINQTYTVTVSNCAGFNSSSVTVLPDTSLAPVANITGSLTIPSCDTTETTQLVVTPQNTATYAWSTGSTSIVTNASIFDVVSVTITNCAGVDSASVTISPDPSITPMASILGIPEVCGNDSTVLSAVDQPTADYMWSTGDTGLSVLGYAGDVIILTAENCLGMESDTVTIIQSPTPNPVINEVANNICVGSGEVVLVASGATTFEWSNTSTNDTLTLSMVSESGSYTLTGYDACGNGIVSSAVDVNIYDLPNTPNLTHTYSNPDFTFTSDASGTHTWFKNGTVVNGVTGSTYTTSVISEGTTVSATVVDGNGCASDTSASYVAIPLGIDGAGNFNIVKVFPNPSTGLFNLVLDNYSNATISVRNILGEVVVSNRVNQSQTEIDLGTYNKGVYFLTISQENAEKTIRLLLQ